MLLDFDAGMKTSGSLPFMALHYVAQARTVLYLKLKFNVAMSIFPYIGMHVCAGK